MPAYKWLTRSSDEPFPETAVTGGRDIDGATIYVGRAYHDGDMIPAKVIPERNVAYVAHGGQEHAKRNFEVLVRGEFGWEFCSNGSVPADAVVAGHTSDGEPLYVGRVLHNGSQTVGKVQQSHGCLYIPFDGEELSFKDYEVLVMH
ncbi:PREDICTED: natterin-3-like isoform X2 [Ceratosolen solmsi marchali]|uniref:Natterin-3-like isoform X2 n=1 Tax=Ceratosolen solmsi marchali TaxID=326594 RepID=A0AAJ6YQ20_9HYME|nr:PREDICTED: natterin-3-like isoform X2 [Ceratosolen solmsi marchali]